MKEKVGQEFFHARINRYIVGCKSKILPHVLFAYIELIDT